MDTIAPPLLSFGLRALLGGIAFASATALEIDPSSREASRKFFNTVYSESEGVRIEWTGSIAAGNAGVTSAAFREAILLRINYFRALAGVPADVAFSEQFNGKAQKAALMMSANRQLSHEPPPSWTFYSAAGAEAATNSNLALGEFGPDAITGYVRDPGSSNTAAGHRRWLLHPQTRVMGSGDVPSTGRYPSANVMWVIDAHTFGPRPATRDDFVAWPPPGFVPRQLVFGRWSLAYPDGDFTNATVTMQRNGNNVPVTRLPVDVGAGENTLVWVPGTNLPKSSVDTVTSVTVANVRVGGFPRTFNYQVIAFDPQTFGADSVEPILTGPAQLNPAQAGTYTFPAVAGATGYQWKHTSPVPFTLVEGAENGLANVTAHTSPGYNVISTEHASGAKSFHLVHLDFEDQALTLERVIVPGTGAQLEFRSRLGYATPGEIATVQASRDGGTTWKTVYSQRGSNGRGEGAFVRRTIPLADFAGREILLRFVYDFAGGGIFNSSSSGVGWYIDDISVSDARELTAPVISDVINTTSFSFTPPAIAFYALSVRPQVFGRFYAEWAPGTMVAVTGAVAPPRPDLLIGDGGGSVMGGGIYNADGAGQKIKASVRANARKTWTVLLENDSETGDSLVVKGSAGSGTFGLQYLDGAVDITAAVTGPGFSVANLPPGASRAITMVLTTPSRVPSGSQATFTITAASVRPPMPLDAVKVKVSTP